MNFINSLNIADFNGTVVEAAARALHTRAHTHTHTHDDRSGTGDQCKVYDVPIKGNHVACEEWDSLSYMWWVCIYMCQIQLNLVGVWHLKC